MEKVLVSACLAGRLCRYDGGHCKSALPEDIQAVLICPEESGGLPTPREPAEIVGGSGEGVLLGTARVRTRNGSDVTDSYVRGAYAALNLCRQAGITRAILKKRSPSCGATAIYDGTFTGSVRPGAGVTAALLQKTGITVEEL